MRKVFFLLLVITCPLASAKTFYVSTTGDNTFQGTITQPWATLAKAISMAYAGDTIYVRGGIYYMTSRNGITLDPSGGVGHDGTISEPICYLAYPGEYPIFDCSGYPVDQTYKWGMRILNADYIKIKGIEIRNIAQRNPNGIVYAIYIENSTYISFENTTVRNIGGVGYGTAGSNKITFTNCDASYCADPYTTSSSGPYGAGDGWQTSSNGERNSYVSMKGCRAIFCSDDGFDSYWNDGTVVYDSCWALSNYKEGGDGNGWKLGRNFLQGSDSIQRRVQHCISANHSVSGFNDNHIWANALIINNVSFNDSIGFYHLASGDNTRTVTYRNNIAFKFWTSPIFNFASQPNVIHDHNSWNDIIAISENDFISLDTTSLYGPRQADGSLPSTNFMKLTPNSKLIDAGTNTALPYYGSAPDIGWFESSQANTTPTNPIYLNAFIENPTPARLEITFDLTLASVVPAPSAFSVNVNSTSRSVSTVAISGTKVLLTLASPAVYGDMITVAYNKPASSPLQTASGGQVGSFSAQNVKNNIIAVNQPPLISLSSPTKSTAYVAPATITIDANASDPDGSVTKVEFYSGTSKLGEKISPPFSFTWKEVPTGTYIITASVTDNKGLSTTSAAVTVVVEKSATTVNQIPIVSIKMPNNKKPKKNDNIVIIAEANDPDGSISKVELKSGSITIAEMNIAPYVYTLQNVDTGLYAITAIATDNLGAVSVSDVLEFRVEDLDNSIPELVNLYPNPNNGEFMVEIINGNPLQDRVLSVINIAGKVLYKINLAAEETSRDISLPDLQSGTYILMLNNNNMILGTKKFIKN